MASALSEINHRKWWKPFTRPFPFTTDSLQHNPNTTNNHQDDPAPIFGAPLQESLQVASVAISIVGPDKKPYIYGFIPVVVAKCGLYLKEHATQTAGIFRISGSTKRIQQLQAIFSQPPFYGKDLEWSNHLATHPNSNQSTQLDLENPSSSSSKPYFSIHDAANLLRRYLMCLPEPLINQSMYQDLRQVLAKHSGDKARQIRLFKSLISTLDPSTQYLLLYLLDLLAVFANRSDKNLMTANNLAVLFQPALCPANPTTQDKLDRIIYAQQVPPANNNNSNNNNKIKNHKNLEIDVEQSAIQQASLLEQESIMKHVKQAQAVVEFLILNQNHFVIGLRPQPRPLNNHSSLRGKPTKGNDPYKSDDRSKNQDWSNDEEGEGERTSRSKSRGSAVSTPRPSSCQSPMQKQQQLLLQPGLEEHAGRLRRSSNLRRSQTLPAHHVNGSSPNHNNPNHWDDILNQSVGSPLPSNLDHQMSPPQYEAGTHNSNVLPISDSK